MTEGRGHAAPCVFAGVRAVATIIDTLVTVAPSHITRVSLLQGHYGGLRCFWIRPGNSQGAPLTCGMSLLKQAGIQCNFHYVYGCVVTKVKWDASNPSYGPLLLAQLKIPYLR